MIASMAIAGAAMPLTQATLRRSVDAAELSAEIAGRQALTLGAAVEMVIDGVSISGTLSAFSSVDRSTSITASVTPATGAGVYAPLRIQFRSTGMVRADLDFAVLPGDTHAGMAIREVTHTIGAASPAFTEVRF